MNSYSEIQGWDFASTTPPDLKKMSLGKLAYRSDGQDEGPGHWTSEDRWKAVLALSVRLGKGGAKTAMIKPRADRETREREP